MVLYSTVETFVPESVLKREQYVVEMMVCPLEFSFTFLIFESMRRLTDKPLQNEHALSVLYRHGGSSVESASDDMLRYPPPLHQHQNLSQRGRQQSAWSLPSDLMKPLMHGRNGRKTIPNIRAPSCLMCSAVAILVHI